MSVEDLGNPGTVESGEEEYVAEMSQLVMICRLVLRIDFAGLENTISKAHTVGPILDPTAYRDGMRNLKDQEQIVRAAKRFREDIEKVVEGLGET